MRRIPSTAPFILSLSLVASLLPVNGAALATEGGGAEASIEAVAAEEARLEVTANASDADSSLQTTASSELAAQVTESSEAAPDAAVPDASAPDAAQNDTTAKSDEVQDADIPELGALRELTEDENVDADGAGDGVLSDAELNALAVEISDAELFDEEKGEIVLRAQAANGWMRVWGAGALDTMQKVVQIGPFATNRGGTVIIATADGYWDALSASGLAGVMSAPVVLTHGDALSPQAKSEIARLKPKRAIVMGGKLAITDGVVADVKKLCPQVDRVWGGGVADTAVAAYRAGSEWGTTAVVATSDGYWDALSAAPYAYWADAPVFLTGGDHKLGADALASIKSGGFKRVLIAGGPLAVSKDVEKQLADAGVGEVIRKAGGGVVETSAEVAKWAVDEGMGIANLTVATSSGYWDALAAAPVCGELNSVLVLVSPDGNYTALDAVYDYSPGSIERGYIIGGTLAVPGVVEKRVTSAWALPSLELSETVVRAGSSVTVTPKLEAGDIDPAKFTYNYGWVRNGSYDKGEWGSDMQNGGKASADTSRTIKFDRTGSFEIFVDAFGPDGGQQTARAKVASYALAGLTVQHRNTKTAAVRTNLGLGAGVNVPGVECRYTYRRSDGATGVVSDWTSNAAPNMDLNAAGGLGYEYDITVEARDAKGPLGSKTAHLGGTSSGDAELDRIVRQIIDNHTGWGDDALKRGYDWIVDNHSYTHMNEYPGGSWLDWSRPYAKEMYLNKEGNCYRYASIVTWVARGLGYEAKAVSGQLLSRGGGWIAHGWCEVDLDGTIYVIDAEQRRGYLYINDMDIDFFMKPFDNAPVFYRHI